MREILFRGKCGYNNEWVEGFYYQAKLCRSDKELCHYITIPHPECDGQQSDHIMVHPETVGQFTGLTDKNGKKAFEHDVIKHHFGDEVGVIRYGEYRNPFGDDSFGGHVGFFVDWVTGAAPETLRKDLAYWMKIVEVIGNIHDNPELLEVPDNA